jgi:hypothetical protein
MSLENRKFTGVVIVLIAMVFSFSSCQKAPENGTELLQMMHDEWRDDAVTKLFFDQETTYFTDGSPAEQQEWKLAMQSPGNLHIRVGDFESGNGMLFTNDSVFFYRMNFPLRAEKKAHYLMTLCFYVHQQEVSKTVEELLGDKFDLSHVKEADWNGKAAYYVGASDSSDVPSSYFVVDKEKLVVLQTVRYNDGFKYSVNVEGYKEIEGKYIPTELTFMRDGQKTMIEKFHNFRFPETIDSDVFNSNRFRFARWE